MRRSKVQRLLCSQAAPFLKTNRALSTANFHFNIVNLHCRGVIFGGTADNGYARMIGPYVHDEEARRRIILLEGPKPAAEILRFINRFKTLPVYGIFRDQQLPSTSPLSSFPHDTSTSGRQDSDRAWASMAAQKSKTWGNETAVGESDIWNPKPRWDTLGRRQDQQLPQHLVQEMKTVREQKYCNNYHLRGECTMRFCMHKHGQRLTKSLAQCLAAVSRRNPCPQGAYCKDLDCIQGHRCPFENCNRTQCKFPQEMHY